MRMTTYLKSIIAAGLAVFVLSGCSSGSSATGLGLGISGTWFGKLLRNGAVYTNFTMSLAQAQDDPDDAFGASVVTGTFSSNDRCIGGGPITGALSANSFSMQVTTPNGTLTMTGTATGSSIAGTWSHAGEIAAEGEDGKATSCNFGGNWAANR